MDKADFQDYVNERYLDQIQWYDRKSLWNQKWYSRLQWGMIGLAAVTPVLISINFRVSSYPFLQWVPVVSSVIVAVLASALKTFKFQENWINYRTTCETLKKEIHLCRAGVGEYKKVEDREALFVERVENLISRENTLWLITAKREEEGKRGK